MASYSIAEAKDRLSALVHAAERGESVEITRYGRTVVAVVPKGASTGSKSSQLESLERIWREIDKVDMPQLDWVGAIREMRDEDWG